MICYKFITYGCLVAGLSLVVIVAGLCGGRDRTLVG